ncbi:hypothetical protein Godav_005907 [Gossypium davidsonii]|uniref:UBC core domain-containing protein n=1 Tax=Gossypium davidsonii TaxID=34287 RepID=A0A7J8S225_GOSDV|nr:hypothetical protein [Gossypium davidsonii]
MSSSSASSRKALSKIACNRLQKELVEWQVNPPSGFKHKVTDNLQRWVIEVNGAAGTLYTNETYQLQVDFPEHYPMEAPQGKGRGKRTLKMVALSRRDASYNDKKKKVKDGWFKRPGMKTAFLANHDHVLNGSRLFDDTANGSIVILILCLQISSTSFNTINHGLQQCPEDNDRYVKNCRNGRSPKQTRWWFHDDKV